MNTRGMMALKMQTRPIHDVEKVHRLYVESWIIRTIVFILSELDTFSSQMTLSTIDPFQRSGWFRDAQPTRISEWNKPSTTSTWEFPHFGSFLPESPIRGVSCCLKVNIERRMTFSSVALWAGFLGLHP